MDMAKYRAMFLSETREHLKNMGRHLLALEEGGEREGIDALFRDAHSIKGMAASMGFVRTAELAHCLEDTLDGIRHSGSVPPGGVDRLLSGVDLLEALVEDIEAGRGERDVSPFISPLPSPSTPLRDPPSPSPDKGEVAVTVRLLPGAAAPAARALLILREMGRFAEIVASDPAEDDLLQGKGVEALTARLRTDLPPAQVRERLSRMTDVERVLLDSAKRPGGESRSRRDDALRTVRMHTGVLDRFVDLTGELITTRYMLQNAAEAGNMDELRHRLDHQARLIGELHHQVLQARMMPLESLTGRLPRMVRDLARATGKDVTLRVEGEQVQLDRAVLEKLGDPLVHLVRNAVDHGIVREGTVTLRAWREKDFVTLEVADDGRGMDPDTLRRKAVERGIITPAQAQGMGEGEIFQLVCIPGFSTAERITETSGRGVGMDVVKAAVEGMGGTLLIASQIGAGTRFLLQLPLSVAIIHLLLVECGGHRLGIPFTRVHKALELDPAEIPPRGQARIVLDGEKIPLYSLRKILRFPAARPSGLVPVVVTEVRGRRVGLVPDRLVGQRQAFVKGLSFPLDRLPGITGSTVLGDGSVIFIVDPQALLEGGMSRSFRPQGDGTCNSIA